MFVLCIGDATKICHCFQHFDVVTLIEVIEHLHLSDLENLVKHVFGYIRPRLVIVTTPNADFNVLFPIMTCGQFRHADHKFEFTRQEFQSWAQNIALTYGYLTEFNGVGQAPLNEQHRNIGTCTQIAIFHRQNDTIKTILTSNEFYQRLSYCNNHELISFIDYPYGVKKPTEIHEQIRYILEMYRLMAEDKARHGECDSDTLPLTISCQTLINHPRLIYLKMTIEELKKIIENVGYKMLDDHQIILSEDPLTCSHNDRHKNENNQYETGSPNEVVESNYQHHQNKECWD